jgi:branched-chain amino acid transport system ATP-binding protein
MAKKFDAPLRWALSVLIRRLQANIEFETSYLPLRIEESQERLDQTLQRLRLRTNRTLVPLERAAGILSPSVSGEIETFRLRVEKTYYWKRLAILKRRSVEFRAEPNLSHLDAKYAPLLNQLEEARKTAIEKATRRFIPQEATPEAFEKHQAVSKSLTTRLAVREQALCQAHTQRVEAWTKRTATRVNRSQTIKNAAQARLAKLHDHKSHLDDLMDNDAILKLDGLSMHFGGLKAVDNLSFGVKRGEIFGLIGPNGAGKTTVFNCITRFYKATSGNLYYRGKNGDVIDLSSKKVHDVIRLGIVRTFQNVEMVWELPILENLLVAAHTQYHTGFFGQLLALPKLKREEKVLRKKAMDVLEDLGLAAYAAFYPLGLPYGILKKVELARTLMAKPDLIILDEPAAGLNDAETDGLKETIRKIRDKYQATIFLVEHDMGLVMDVCDTVCAISFGKKLAIGSPVEIQTNKAVREAYLGGE